MSTIVEFAGQGSAEAWAEGEGVALHIEDIFNGTYVNVPITPGEAVKLSRALVAAAAEALGVSV